MATTALDLYKSARRLIGALASGEAPTAAEGADGLVSLNDMLAAWGLEGLTITATTTNSGALVGGQSLYLIGQSGSEDWSNPRPIEILEAFIREGTTDYPVAIVDSRRWAQLADKQTSDRPTMAWYNPTAPDGTLQFDKPASAADTFYYVALVPLQRFTALTEAVTLPDETLLAVRSNLALLLAPEYERNPTPMLYETAKTAKMALLARNAANRAKIAQTDFHGSTRQYFDIDQGW
jgi:hypothetical protein